MPEAPVTILLQAEPDEENGKAKRKDANHLKGSLETEDDLHLDQGK